MMISCFLLIFFYPCKGIVGLAPEFIGSIVNVTISQGRDASFACSVRNLGGFKVAWIKADTKAILAIHDHVITNNDRLDITHNDKDTWTLTLKNVQTEDRGPYMCQVNSTPVRKQIAYLEVVIPPAISDTESSGDQIVPEGGSAKLICRATGFPQPEVTWRRKDKGMITVKNGGRKVKSHEVRGEMLHLPSITRSEMGSYMCVAMNGVPPAVSKNIQLNVSFQPQISSEQQLVGAPTGTQVVLTCYAEAWPKPINYWTYSKDEMIVPNDRFKIEEEELSIYRMRTTLTINNIQGTEFSGYKCVSKNTIGVAEEEIEVYEIKTVSTNAIPGPESEWERTTDYMDMEDTINAVEDQPHNRLQGQGQRTDNQGYGYEGYLGGQGDQYRGNNGGYDRDFGGYNERQADRHQTSYGSIFGTSSDTRRNHLSSLLLMFMTLVVAITCSLLN